MIKKSKIEIKQRKDGWYLHTISTKGNEYGQFYSNNPEKSNYVPDEIYAVQRFIKFYSQFE